MLGRQHKGLELLEELHKFIISGLQLEVRILEVVFFRVFHLTDLLFHLSLLHLRFRLDPSTPVMSASAAPAGLLSSPGGMSDVRGTLPPPGLPLSDPPRVSGNYGIPSLDPIFGMSSGSLPCENAGRVPVPVQAPVVPPPPPPGVGDPFAQILVGQSANESADGSDGTRDATKSYGKCWSVPTGSGTRDQSRNIEW